jgi:hypothetical protein
VARTVPAIDEQDLERALLRKSVGALAGGSQRCADCGRTPLIGETLHRYPGGLAVCELCRPLRREAPDHSERVRTSEAGLAVRIHRLGAVSPPAPAFAPE